VLGRRSFLEFQMGDVDVIYASGKVYVVGSEVGGVGISKQGA